MDRVLFPHALVVLLLIVTGCGGAPEADRSEATVSTPSSADVGGEPDEPSQEEPMESESTAGGPLDLGKITLTAPEGWSRKAPAVGFILAEFSLPAAEGDDADARLTVSVAGGSVEANVDRWKDQFGGKPEQESEEQVEIAGLDVTLVDFAGDFTDQRGPFAPATKQEGYRMLAAIIPVDGELHFIKCTGPQRTMAAHADAFDAFVKSLQKN